MDKKNIITIIDDGYKEIEVKPIDYVNNKYTLDENDNKLKIDGNAYYSIPSKSLSTYFKGKIGEHMYCNILNLSLTDAEDFYKLTDRGCTYDIINCSGTDKIDVKSGFENHYGKTGKATSFMHFLATNKPGCNGVQISESKYKKNYKAEGINRLVCVDLFSDSSILPYVYSLPTDSNEVKNYSTITIPSSGKTVYNKYKTDISDVFINE